MEKGEGLGPTGPSAPDRQHQHKTSARDAAPLPVSVCSKQEVEQRLSNISSNINRFAEPNRTCVKILSAGRARVRTVRARVRTMRARALTMQPDQV